MELFSRGGTGGICSGLEERSPPNRNSFVKDLSFLGAFLTGLTLGGPEEGAAGVGVGPFGCRIDSLLKARLMIPPIPPEMEP